MSRVRRTSIVAAGVVLASALVVPAATSVASDDAGAGGGVGGTSTDFPSSRVLDIQWEQEEKGWWCGPAASRMALKSWVNNPMGQGGLADLMVTYEPSWSNPFDWQTADVGAASDGMNEALDISGLPQAYTAVEIPSLGKKGDPSVADVLKDNARQSIGRSGHAMVVNIRSTEEHKLNDAYPDRDVYHYITVYGYSEDGNTLYVADPASGMNDDYANVPQKYAVPTQDLANILNVSGDDGVAYAADLTGQTN
ncbi:C39 family peptidase [Luteipulveratus mongoliensis]|uniref:Peptidase C39-like domain-containing protein n=1 Tax=Luteipulveratus mongoliensis TaxID=571913 RepID=A0A0K1JGQ8_9MICO|nr:C39 family peptidase [Luteipulveratus mongoliensis]AKU15891.1 hypothetical protein VV02_08545 [Luteipulveratus mongoliensis]